MSDFLSNLIAKSRGSGVRTIRPWAPSRFEPVRAEEPALEIGEAGVAPRTAAPAQAPFEPIRASERPFDVREATAPPRKSSPAPESVHEGRPQTSEAEPVARVAPAPPEQPRAVEPERPASPSAPESVREVPMRVLVEARRPEAPEPERAERLKEASPAREAPPVPQNTLLIVERLSETRVLDGTETIRERVVTREKESTLPSARRDAREARQPLPQRMRRAAPLQAVTAEPSREPDIHVTIGRVEIRANGPAPAPARRGGPAAMSLDEYLRRRTSGGER